MLFPLQMTAQEVRLCGLLLKEHFGEVVEKIGVHLLRSGTLSLRALAHETSTSLDLVTVALTCVACLFGLPVFILFNHANLFIHYIHTYIHTSYITHVVLLD